MWSGISQNSASCRDSRDQEYHRTACPAMIHVIRNFTKQLVLPWFMWSGISKNSTSCHDPCDQEFHKTACPAMIHVIRNFSKQHVLSCFMWSGISHTLIFVHPLESVLLFFRYRFIFTRIKLDVILFSFVQSPLCRVLSFFWKQIQSEERNQLKSANTNLWFTLVSMSLRVFLEISSIYPL